MDLLVNSTARTRNVVVVIVKLVWIIKGFLGEVVDVSKWQHSYTRQLSFDRRLDEVINVSKRQTEVFVETGRRCLWVQLLSVTWTS